MVVSSAGISPASTPVSMVSTAVKSSTIGSVRADSTGNMSAGLKPISADWVHHESRSPQAPPVVANIDRFDQKLPDDSTTARAERQPDRHLLPAGQTARPRSRLATFAQAIASTRITAAHEDQQRPSQVTVELRPQRHHDGPAGAVGLGMHPTDPGRNRFPLRAAPARR